MTDANDPPAPSTHKAFLARFPELGEAWKKTAEAGQKGPLDEKTARLVKLAVAIGAGHEGAVHASVRKAKALGLGEAEIAQVVALSASTVGLPSAVAAWTWCEDVLNEK